LELREKAFALLAAFELHEKAFAMIAALELREKAFSMLAPDPAASESKPLSISSSALTLILTIDDMSCLLYRCCCCDPAVAVCDIDASVAAQDTSTTIAVHYGIASQERSQMIE
jgi:hypothetical protein